MACPGPVWRASRGGRAGKGPATLNRWTAFSAGWCQAAMGPRHGHPAAHRSAAFAKRARAPFGLMPRRSSTSPWVASRVCAAGAAGTGERFEIEHGPVRSPRCPGRRKDLAGAWPATAWKVSPWAAPVAVIDDQRGAAVTRDPGADRGGRCRAGPGRFSTMSPRYGVSGHSRCSSAAKRWPDRTGPGPAHRLSGRPSPRASRPESRRNMPASAGHRRISLA